MNILTKIFGTKHDREVKRLMPLVHKINEHYEAFHALSEAELVGMTDKFKQRLADGETLDDILPEAYAVVKEVCRRLVGTSWNVVGHDTEWNMIPFDVQLIGAIALHQGKITEMATGEGK
ncbi:MAG: preprotein translocase subunit SecA, partial [Candidatus Zixiibacteriota bacterium]